MSKTRVEINTETLVEFAAVHRDQMEAVTHQLGVLTETVTALAIQVGKQGDVSERNAQTIATQAQITGELVALVNQLMPAKP